MTKKKIFFYFLLLITSFSSTKAQVNIQWQSRYTSAGSNTDKAEDMALDAAGNVYVTGIGRGASGGFDFITIKYNATGVQQWKAEYNGTGNGLDEAHAIAIDVAGNVYVTGLSNGGATPGFDYTTVKYNSAGVQQWASRYNNATNGNDEAWDVAVDNSGNVYVTGTSDGASGTTNSAGTTIKYNSAGAQQWAKRYDGAGNDIDVCYAIYLDVAANVFVTGTSQISTLADFDFITIKYNTAGTEQWAKNYNSPSTKYDEGRAIVVDGSGNVYVTGYSQTAVLTNYDFTTIKYNSAGTPQWVKAYNGTGDGDDRANAIVLDAVGNVYVTGYSVGVGITAQDMLTIKYNNGGTQKWVNRYNGISNGYDEGKAIAIDSKANVYITGYSYSSVSNSDYTTIKYDSVGVQQWLTKYNGTANNVDQSAAIVVDNSGNVHVSGFSKGSGTNEDYETIKYCQLTANAGNDTSICKGTSVMLKAAAIAAVSYVWTPTTGLSNPNIFNPIATPTITTSYVVSITNGTGCVDTDTIKITVVPLPTPIITASGPTTFCIGDSVKLTVTKDTSYFWSTSSTLQSIKVFSAGTYTVTVKNSIGCAGSASIKVIVNALPTIDAGLHKNNCTGSSIILKATGGNSYVWHPGKTLNDSTIASPNATPLAATTYTVIGTSAAGCKNMDTVSITLLSLPVIDAGLNNNVCKGVSVGMQATGGASYMWTPGNTLNDSTIANPSATPLVTTTYTVVGTGINGCKNKDIIKITVLQLPAIDAGLNDSLCFGLSANLQATDGISYTWHPGNTLDDSTIFDPVATPITTTTYTVVGKGINGCFNSDIVKIKVFPMLSIDAGLNDSVCFGKNISLQATGGLSYSWSPNNSLSNPSVANPIANPTVNTTYTVIGTGAGGCSKSDIVSVKVLQLPSIDAGLNDSLCFGLSINLKATNGISYIWHPGNTLGDSTIFNPIATPITTTTYTVVGKGINGCVNSDIVKIKVFPKLSIDAGLNDSVCFGKNIPLQATGGLSYTWSPGSSLNNTTLANPIATPTVNTTYTLVGTGVGGCSKSDIVSITVLPNPTTTTIYLGRDTLYCNQSAPNYQWFKDGLPISGANGQYYFCTQNGNYYVEAYNAVGCSTPSNIINILDISVAEIDGFQLLNIYPNPVTNNLNLEFNISRATSLRINLITISGQLIFSDNISRFTGTYKKQIDLNQYPEGIYFLQIITDNQAITKKVVKQ